jgi:regulator of sigma D
MSQTMEPVSTTENRRPRSREFARKLVEERTEMLVLFCRVAGCAPYDSSKERASAQRHLEKFCQVLMDYVAAGHFGLYERIVSGNERRKAVSDLADELYPRIAPTTDAAVDFNDKYDCSDHCPMGDLEADMSRLGEQLAVRAELEDQILRVLTEG